jgi:hypothetical protein
MILFSLGPFGPFTAWWDSAIARIAEIGLGPTAVVNTDGPEEFATSLIRSAAPHLVVVSRRPSPALRALLAESGAPLLVGFDDPREGLFELVTGHGLDFRAATQVLADSCAGATICAAMPKALLVGSDAARHDTAGILRRVAEFCGVNAPPEQLGIAAPPGPTAAAMEWWDALDPDERGIAEGALRGYAAWLAGHGIGEMTWDRRLFRCAADHGRTAGAAIELGEAPGVLVDGPWIGLPPGRWAASVTLAVSREVNGVRFDLAIHADSHPHLLATGSIICDGRGLGSATLLFAIEPAWGQTVSLTVASTAPAPGGRLALGNVVLAPSSSEHAGIPAELSSALSLT